MICKFCRWLFGCCDHKWIFVKGIRMYNKGSDSMPYGHKIIFRCGKCNSLKRKVL